MKTLMILVVTATLAGCAVHPSDLHPTDPNYQPPRLGDGDLDVSDIYSVGTILNSVCLAMGVESIGCRMFRDVNPNYTGFISPEK